MYVLMYATVDPPGNIRPGLDQAYMAGLMTAPMVILDLLLMRAMYGNRRLNAAILVASAVGGLACFVVSREQALIYDREFLRAR